MASVQQSFNQLIGSVAGAATTGAYFRRQGPEYQAGKLTAQAKKLYKAQEGYAKQGMDIGDLMEKEEGLLKKAAELNPTERTLANYQLSGEDALPYNQRLEAARKLREPAEPSEEELRGAFAEAKRQPITEHTEEEMAHVSLASAKRGLAERQAVERQIEAVEARRSMTSALEERDALLRAKLNHFEQRGDET